MKILPDESFCSHLPVTLKLTAVCLPHLESVQREQISPQGKQGEPLSSPSLHHLPNESFLWLLHSFQGSLAGKEQWEQNIYKQDPSDKTVATFMDTENSFLSLAGNSSDNIPWSISKMSIHLFVNTNALPHSFSHRKVERSGKGRGESSLSPCNYSEDVSFYFMLEWPNLYYSSVALIIIINQETRISMSNYHSE